jgi:hypothetical protein
MEAMPTMEGKPWSCLKPALHTPMCSFASRVSDSRHRVAAMADRIESARCWPV